MNKHANFSSINISNLLSNNNLSSYWYLLPLLGIECHYCERTDSNSFRITEFQWRKFKNLMLSSHLAIGIPDTIDFTKKSGVYLLIREVDFRLSPLRVKIGMSDTSVLERVRKEKSYQNAYILRITMVNKAKLCENELKITFNKYFKNIRTAPYGSSGDETFEIDTVPSAIAIFDSVVEKFI